MSNNNILEDHHNNGGGRSVKNGMIMNKSKATSDHDHNYSWGNIGNDQEDGFGEGGGDLVGGFSWPPRSYTCTFCKREFRSAQALGGHMNVHRRDRARLRQMPSSSYNNLFNLNLLDPNPNPNPNFSTYCFSNMSPTSTMLPPLISSSPQPNFLCVPRSTTTTRPRGCQNNLTMMKTQIAAPYGVCKYDSRFRSENEGEIVKKSEIVRLNLEIGLLGDSKSDELDLELRLGCS